VKPPLQQRLPHPGIISRAKPFPKSSFPSSLVNRIWLFLCLAGVFSRFRASTASCGSRKTFWRIALPAVPIHRASRSVGSSTARLSCSLTNTGAAVCFTSGLLGARFLFKRDWGKTCRSPIGFLQPLFPLVPAWPADHRSAYGPTPVGNFAINRQSIRRFATGWAITVGWSLCETAASLAPGFGTQCGAGDVPQSAGPWASSSRGFA